MSLIRITFCVYLSVKGGRYCVVLVPLTLISGTHKLTNFFLGKLLTR